MMPLGKALLDALDRMGYGGLVLGTAGQVKQINSTAKRLLVQLNGQDDRKTDLDWSRQTLKSLLCGKSTDRFIMGQDSWIVTRRLEKRPLILHAVPLETGLSGLHMAVILVDLDSAPRPTAEALQKIFDLTTSEARLAVELASGKSLEEIALAAQVTIGTIRKQLGSVFTKTNTNRQAELVALLARVSVLP
jgi:DNA-binding CsgD family transcriptional regulator